jgi:hypothetical protein
MFDRANEQAPDETGDDRAARSTGHLLGERSDGASPLLLHRLQRAQADIKAGMLSAASANIEAALELLAPHHTPATAHLME